MESGVIKYSCSLIMLEALCWHPELALLKLFSMRLETGWSVGGMAGNSAPAPALLRAPPPRFFTPVCCVSTSSFLAFVIGYTNMFSDFVYAPALRHTTDIYSGSMHLTMDAKYPLPTGIRRERSACSVGVFFHCVS